MLYMNACTPACYFCAVSPRGSFARIAINRDRGKQLHYHADSIAERRKLGHGKKLQEGARTFSVERHRREAQWSVTEKG